MSSLALPVPAGSRWSMWRAQASTILNVELRKNFVTKRGFWIYLLALAPAAIIWIHSFVTMQRSSRTR